MDECVVAQVFKGKEGYYLILNVGPFESEDLAVREIDNWADEVFEPSHMVH